ncbi:MAG TPA: hypothetical protein VD866_29475 [Urbifossiella sp.]|nr:hypothetical protein [Urbifossiella sp.]
MTAHRLARFTPAAGPDAAELLFQMGRAAAPTPLRWKLGVAALLLTNTAALAWIILRPEPAVPTPVVVPVVMPVPVLEPSPGYQAADPPHYGPIRVHDDPDRWPAPEPLAGVAPPGPPLTPLDARRGVID